MQLSLEILPGRENCQIVSDVDPRGVKLQQFDLFRVLAGTKNDPERQLFASFSLVAGEPSQIQFHLPLVLGFKAALLQLDDDQALQLAVVEEEIDIEVISVELDALLPRNKGKASTELQQEALEFPQYGVLEVAFDVPIAMPRKSST